MCVNLRNGLSSCWLVTVPRRKVVFKLLIFGIHHRVSYLVPHIMLNMALLLCVVNKGEHVVVNQVAAEVNPPVEVGFDICGTTPEPDFSVNQGKPHRPECA